MLNLRVGQSLINSKHKAVIDNAKSEIIPTNQCAPRKSAHVREYRPLSARLLHQLLTVYNWSGIIAAIDNKSDSMYAIYDDSVLIYC